MSATTTANARPSAACGSRRLAVVPTSAPAAVEPASAAVSPMSGAAPATRWLTRAAIPVKAMITSEVATARRKAAPSQTLRSGTTRNPPPIPKKPVSTPTPNPAATTRGHSGCGHPPSSSGRPAPARCHVAPAAASITGMNARTSTSPLTAALATAPASEPAAAGAEKRSASRQHTWPWRASALPPTAAATATTISDAVDAGPTPSSRT
jgi:hypothetical protein